MKVLNHLRSIRTHERSYLKEGFGTFEFNVDAEIKDNCTFKLTKYIYKFKWTS